MLLSSLPSPPQSSMITSSSVVEAASRVSACCFLSFVSPGLKLGRHGCRPLVLHRRVPQCLMTWTLRTLPLGVSDTLLHDAPRCTEVRRLIPAQFSVSPSWAFSSSHQPLEVLSTPCSRRGLSIWQVMHHNGPSRAHPRHTTDAANTSSDASVSFHPLTTQDFHLDFSSFPRRALRTNCVRQDRHVMYDRVR